MNLQRIINIIFFTAFIGISAFILLNLRKKIAYVNVEKVISNSESIKQVAKELQLKEQEYKAKQDTLRAEFESSLKDYEKKKATYSNNELDKAEQKLRKLQDQYAQFTKTGDENFKKQQYKLTQKCVEKINIIIKKYSEVKKLDLVISNQAGGTVLYVSDAIEITGDIIELLKKEEL